LPEDSNKNAINETSIIIRWSLKGLGNHPISRVNQDSGGEIINGLTISDAPHEKKGLESLAW